MLSTRSPTFPGHNNVLGTSRPWISKRVSAGPSNGTAATNRNCKPPGRRQAAILGFEETYRVVIFIVSAEISARWRSGCGSRRPGGGWRWHDLRGQPPETGFDRSPPVSFTRSVGRIPGRATERPTLRRPFLSCTHQEGRGSGQHLAARSGGNDRRLYYRPSLDAPFAGSWGREGD